MTRANATIAILAILILVLCVLCYVGKPLATSRYVPEMATLLNSIGGTSIGDKILNHYLNHIRDDVIHKVGPTKGLTLEDKVMLYFLLAGRLFAASVALAGFIACAALFLINGGGHQLPVSKTKTAITVAMVILAGTIIRLILAKVIFGNFDMQSYDVVVSILHEGGNVYARTERYNYSPVWFMVLWVLKQIQLAFGVPFFFVVRSFLCCVDLLTLGILILIAGIRKLPATRTAIFFYLSPVSFLMTGFHGQFENLAMLMVLTGIFMYLRFETRPVLKAALLWLFATAGMIVKHSTFYELIICLRFSIKRYWIKVPLFAVSVVIFLSLFIPYWKTGSEGIIRNVFQYGSMSGHYGVTSLITWSKLRYLFILALFVFPLFLKSRDIIVQCLLGVLFFLTFTTGIAVQYLVLPVALGALRPSKSFLFYTLAASVLVIGSEQNAFIPGFQFFPWNVVWVAVICWFIVEMRLDRQAEVEIPAKTKIRQGPPVKTASGSFRRRRNK
jgi:hypothetical protein